MIDTMAAAATRRIVESVNRSAGQHLRAMREHAEEYASKHGPTRINSAQAAINTVAPSLTDIYAMCAESDTAYQYAEWLCAAAGVDYPPKG